MPQLVAIAVIGAGLVAGYKWAAKKMEEARIAAERAETELRRQAAQAGEPKDLGMLELDPASGEYRPRRV